MPCSCCTTSCDPAARYFDAALALKELRSYQTSGPGPTTRALVAGVVTTGLGAGTLLDVGSGVGVLTFELLKAGFASATCVDLSVASLEASRTEAQRLGYSDRISWKELDFATAAGSLPPADTVVLDRVVCCYHAFDGLLREAAAHARQVLALSYPRDRWYVRATVAIENAIRRLRGIEFRVFVHPAATMEALLASSGFKRVSRRATFAWNMDIYARVVA